MDAPVGSARGVPGLVAPSEVTVGNREQLLYTLTEAAEIEHNLMCCYLYAAFGMKSDEDEGLTAEQLAAVRTWRQAIINVAVEEMTHLALVSNLIVAVGGTPHFSRPNFPIGPGYHPAGIQVKLARFDADTLQHFIHLERPAGSDEPDGKGFEPEHDYHRSLGAFQTLMPSGQHYETVGDLYGSIRAGLEALCEQYPESQVFIGLPEHQVGHDVLGLPGLMTVGGLADALRAIDIIVEQGEGAPSDSVDGHFQAFVDVRTAYAAMREQYPDFEPSRPVAENPVMRKPVTPGDRVWIENEEAAKLVDLGNAIYAQFLRLLCQAYGHDDLHAKQLLVITATEMMHALTPAAEQLTFLPANGTDDCTAGLSFATLKAIATVPHGPAEWTMLSQRFWQLVRVADELRPLGRRMDTCADVLRRTARAFDEAMPESGRWRVEAAQ